MIAKEITKIHEAFYRDKIETIENFDSNFKGEVTIVISELKDNKKDIVDEKKIINKAKKLLKKYSLKDTVDLIMSIEKVNRKKFINCV